MHSNLTRCRQEDGLEGAAGGAFQVAVHSNLKGAARSSL